MGKKIVLCFDGTWNSPESETNIHKLFEALGPENEDQVPFYYTGVGAEGSALRKIVEGATGEGIVDKIRQGYDDLASVYEPGDQIYIFGFSRGAYAARCLANMVADFGLPTRYFGDADSETKKYNPALGDKIFNEYKRRGDGREFCMELREHCVAKAAVQMVGLFDTVGSLGLTAAFGKVNRMRYGYLDAEWHPNILNAYQALAIDEKRVEFKPLRWTEGPGTTDPYHRMEQVWFPGVHADVGGGYENRDLADNSLGWMINKARESGLTFSPEKILPYAGQTPDELDSLHQSWKPFWGPAVPRKIPEGSAVSGFASLMEEMGIYRPDNLPDGGPAEVARDGTNLEQREVQPGGWVKCPAPADRTSEQPKASAGMKLQR